MPVQRYKTKGERGRKVTDKVAPKSLVFPLQNREINFWWAWEKMPRSHQKLSIISHLIK